MRTINKLAILSICSLFVICGCKAKTTTQKTPEKQVDPNIRHCCVDPNFELYTDPNIKQNVYYTEQLEELLDLTWNSGIQFGYAAAMSGQVRNLDEAKHWAKKLRAVYQVSGRFDLDDYKP